MLDDTPSALSGAWDTIAEINQALLEALRAAAQDAGRARDLAGAMDVRDARCLAKRVLRVAFAATERARLPGCTASHADSGQFRRQ